MLQSGGVRAFHRRGCQDLFIDGNQHREVLSGFFLPYSYTNSSLVEMRSHFHEQKNDWSLLFSVFVCCWICWKLIKGEPAPGAGPSLGTLCGECCFTQPLLIRPGETMTHDRNQPKSSSLPRKWPSGFIRTQFFSLFKKNHSTQMYKRCSLTDNLSFILADVSLC